MKDVHLLVTYVSPLELDTAYTIFSGFVDLRGIDVANPVVGREVGYMLEESGGQGAREVVNGGRDICEWVLTSQAMAVE